MKILYCIHGTFNPGGMERMITAKANELAARGHQVIIATSHQDGRPDFFPLAPGVIRMDADVMYSPDDASNPFSKYFIRRKKMKEHRRFLKHLIDTAKPDVVVSTVGNEVGFLPDIAREAATIAEIHFSKYYRLQRRRKGLWRLIDHYLTRSDARHLARYDRFVVLTHADARNWKNFPNLAVIPNFITPRHSQPAALQSHRAIAVGRLDFQKNYDDMINVWAYIHKSFPDWTLEIYGEGPEKTRLQRLIEAKNLEGVVILKGTTPPGTDVYAQGSILIHTARYEGFVLVLMEAMSAGVPVVAYDCPYGPAEIIDHGHTGFLIPQGDVGAMCKAISRLIEDHECRRQMGRLSFERAKRFAPTEIMDRWENLFKEAIAQKSNS